jgi:hypothetical protein
VINQTAGQAGKSGQLAAFIQQRIRHVYRRQRRRSWRYTGPEFANGRSSFKCLETASQVL